MPKRLTLNTNKATASPIHMVALAPYERYTTMYVTTYEHGDCPKGREVPLEAGPSLSLSLTPFFLSFLFFLFFLFFFFSFFLAPYF